MKKICTVLCYLCLLAIAGPILAEESASTDTTGPCIDPMGCPETQEPEDIGAQIDPNGAVASGDASLFCPDTCWDSYASCLGFCGFSDLSCRRDCGDEKESCLNSCGRPET